MWEIFVKLVKWVKEGMVILFGDGCLIVVCKEMSD